MFRGGVGGLGPVGVECVRKCRIICSMYVIKWLPPVRQSMDAATDATRPFTLQSWWVDGVGAKRSPMSDEMCAVGSEVPRKSSRVVNIDRSNINVFCLLLVGSVKALFRPPKIELVVCLSRPSDSERISICFHWTRLAVN